MFVAGLVVGPLIGIVVGIALARSRPSESRWAWPVLGLLLVAVAFSAFLSLELRLGLVAGVLLGLLVANTPPELVETEESGSSTFKSETNPTG